MLEDAESLTFMRDGVNGKAAAWQARVEARGKADADWAGRHCLMLQGPTLSPVFGEELLRYRASSPKASTRNLAGDLLKRSISGMPALLGGSADLACSTKATLPGEPYFAANQPLGRNLAFGIREHAMGAIGNGLALSGWHLPFTSTFLSFFDYMKTPVRLAALMNLSHLFVFSHDSLHVGEDGPTHQPVEHLNSMRLIPRLRVVRPCNDQETAWAFLRFFQEGGATALVTTRQDLPMIRPQDGADDAEGYRRFRSGAYVMADLGSRPAEVVFCASGSEVSLAMSCAQALLDQSGVPCRVVSIPCLEDFAAADGAFRSELLLAHQRRLLVPMQAASYRAVDAFSPADLLLIDIQSFGESGPAGAVAEAKGFSVTAVLERIRQRIALN